MDRSLTLLQLASRYKNIPGPITPEMTFQEMGMKEYEVLDFMLKVEETYGIALDDSRLLSCRTIRDVEDAVNRCMTNA
ncbi:MAG: acyl carrier protein [Solobacterium sp.]|nr:acyl carrier protein [Solobacterium sp.]MBR2793930.1 acyl carrier protein [Solobacterium sp.]